MAFILTILQNKKVYVVSSKAINDISQRALLRDIGDEDNNEVDEV